MLVLVREATEDPEVRALALDILLTRQQAGRMFGWPAARGVPQTPSWPPMQWMEPAADASLTDHERMSATVDVSMPGMASTEDLDRLARAEGHDAERLMTPHHRGGVAMAEEADTRAEEAPVRQLAQSIVNSQNPQVAVLRSMLAARGGTADGS